MAADARGTARVPGDRHGRPEHQQDLHVHRRRGHGQHAGHNRARAVGQVRHEEDEHRAGHHPLVDVLAVDVGHDAQDRQQDWRDGHHGREQTRSPVVRQDVLGRDSENPVREEHQHETDYVFQKHSVHDEEHERNQAELRQEVETSTYLCVII